MQGDGLAVFSILWGTAIAFALAAVTMLDSQRKCILRSLWAIGAAFAGAAIAWPWLSENWPAARTFGNFVGGNQLAVDLIGAAIFSLLVWDFRTRRKWLSERRFSGAQINYDDNELRKLLNEYIQKTAALEAELSLNKRSLDDMRELKRTAFLLSAAYVQSEYQQRLKTQLELIPFDTAMAGTVITDEYLVTQTARIEEYLNRARSDLYGSHWLEEFNRVERHAEQSADGELRRTGSPEGVNPYAYREFHIACMKRDYVADFLKRAVNDARSHDQQMLKMVRERPDLHK